MIKQLVFQLNIYVVLFLSSSDYWPHCHMTQCDFIQRTATWPRCHYHITCKEFAGMPIILPSSWYNEQFSDLSSLCISYPMMSYNKQIGTSPYNQQCYQQLDYKYKILLIIQPVLHHGQAFHNLFTNIYTLSGNPLNTRINYFSRYWDVLNIILAHERTGKVTHMGPSILL